MSSGQKDILTKVILPLPTVFTACVSVCAHHPGLREVLHTSPSYAPPRLLDRISNPPSSSLRSHCKRKTPSRKHHSEYRGLHLLPIIHIRANPLWRYKRPCLLLSPTQLPRALASSAYTTRIRQLGYANSSKSHALSTLSPTSSGSALSSQAFYWRHV